MATIAYTHQRYHLTTLALSTLGTCPRWDASLTAYLSAQELQHAFSEWGPKGQADDDCDAHRYEHGTKSLAPAAKTKSDRLKAEYKRQEEHWETHLLPPMYETTRALLDVPAPNVAAAVFKATMIDVDEAWNDALYEADCYQIIRNDFARLESGQPQTAAFDPAAWLADFEANAGGYIVTPDNDVRLVRSVVTGTRKQHAQAAAMEAALTPEQTEAVAALIGSRRQVSDHDNPTWADLKRDYLAAEKALSDHCSGSKQSRAQREVDRLCDKHANALDALLLAPSPDLEALAFKLQIHAAQTVNDGWHTAGTIADIRAEDARRLIGTTDKRAAA